MIALIRIRGQVKVDRKIVDTLKRLRLTRKYTCIILEPSKEQAGMITKLRDFIAFGEVSQETLEKVIDARGKAIDSSKKIDSKKVAEEMSKGATYDDVNLRNVFRLHPPRKGINAKLHFPKGVLGDNKEKINDLLLRML